jgi:hypothetical protein
MTAVSPWQTLAGPDTVTPGTIGTTLTGNLTGNPTHVVLVFVSVTYIVSDVVAIPGTTSTIMKYNPGGEVMVNDAGIVHE